MVCLGTRGEVSSPVAIGEGPSYLLPDLRVRAFVNPPTLRLCDGEGVGVETRTIAGRREEISLIHMSYSEVVKV